jgi:hypothetical protein
MQDASKAWAYLSETTFGSLLLVLALNIRLGWEWQTLYTHNPVEYLRARLEHTLQDTTWRVLLSWPCLLKEAMVEVFDNDKHTSLCPNLLFASKAWAYRSEAIYGTPLLVKLVIFDWMTVTNTHTYTLA